MGKRRSRQGTVVTLLVVASVVVAALCGAAFVGAAPLLEGEPGGPHTITPSAGTGGSITPDTPQSVTEGDTPAFTITPAVGYHVDDVTVDDSSVGAVTSYTFDPVYDDHTIHAAFAVDTFTITAIAGAGGSISPSGAVSVDYGQDRGFTITPATGYHVADVKVDGSSVGAVTSHTFNNVTGNHTISASFAINTYTITPSAGAGGSISPNTPQTVAHGGSQGFTISPATGYHVADVQVDGSSVGPVTSYTFNNVTGNRSISATFAINTYTITASAGAGGSITPSGVNGVAYGGNLAFTITPATGYHIASVTVDGVSVDAVPSYAFNNVTANHTISATFAVNTYTITPSAGANGSISPATPQTVAHGGERGFTITPAAGYHVVDVVVDGISVGAVTSYTFVNVTAGHTISAAFAINTYTVTPVAGEHGSISPATPQVVQYGADLTFTIKAKAGYYVADVLVDGVSVGPVATYTFTGVAADHTLSAGFAQGIQTGLWISTARSVVDYGGSTILYGELYDPTGQQAPVGLGGRSVIVQRAPTAGGPWADSGAYVTSVVPGEVGQISLVVTLEAPTYFRLRYVTEPQSEYGGSVSAVHKVGVRPLLGRPVSPAKARPNRYFTVRGSLKPHFTAGQKTVQVQVQRYRKGRWSRVKTILAGNRDKGDFTEYRLRVRLATRGKYRFKAVLAAPGWASVTTTASRPLVVE